MPISSQTTLTPYNNARALTPLVIIIDSQYSNDDYDDSASGGDITGAPLNDGGGNVAASYMRMNTGLAGLTGATTITYTNTTYERSHDLIYNRKSEDSNVFYIKFDPTYIAEHFSKFEIMDYVAAKEATSRDAAVPAAFGAVLKYDLLNVTSTGVTGTDATYYSGDSTWSSDYKCKFEKNYHPLLWMNWTPKASGGGADPIEFSSSAIFSVQENQTSVGTVQASGGDGTTLTYSITGGVDSTKFSINSSSGALTFNSAPDFETPDSAASSNTYAIIVTATDGTTPVTQSITVNVTDVSEATAIVFSSSATFSVQENQTSVETVQASGGDGTTLTYSITGGVDSTKFSINSSSGVLTFNSAPDFENPDSAASSNAYAIIVTATDGTTPVTQSITVNVTNANDPTTGKPSITSSGNTASPLVGDTLTATQGNIVDQDGLGALSYEWKNSSGATVLGTSSTYTIQQNDKDYTITVSVSFTDGGSNAVGPLTSNATGIVTVANSPATGFPTITGTASEGGTLTANVDTIADTDGLPGSYTYQWKRGGSAISGATNSTYTVANADVGTTITVTVSFTDNAGNAESRTSAGTDIAALDELTYFWTEYFADASNNIPGDSTLIHYGIYNTTKISGVQFTYDVSGTTLVADVSYSIVDNSNNNTMIHKKDWPIHIINNTNDVANKAMVFAGAVNQSINGMNTGVFAIVKGNVTLASIVNVVDNNSDLLAADQYSFDKPANPPEITEPGGRKLGDINFDGAVDGTDADILEAYLLNDSATFSVYDDGTTNNETTGKTAGDIITDMTEYDWQTYVDVNNNNIIDVGDLVRLLSKIANSNFSMTNGT